MNENVHPYEKSGQQTEKDMEETENDFGISRKLCEWYDAHKRDLPWRHSRDPYIIWISEIILQQTRVAQGLDYFNRFVERFPDIRSLAEASEDEVLKYWQGLGYYSRARNLHAAARFMAEHYDARFPQTYPEVRALKGIGDYTAAAIVSFAWNLPYAVVDGNVYRVLARFFGIDTPIDTGAGKKYFAELAQRLLPPKRAGLHNQAIMELGALQCVPQAPACTACPLADACVAYANQSVSLFPVKQGRTKTRDRFFHYFYIIYNGKTFLQKRTKNDIWKGLYEFPLIETDEACEWTELSHTNEFDRLFSGISKRMLRSVSPLYKHVLSHQTLYTTFYQLEINEAGGLPHDFDQVPIEGLDQYAVPRLIQKYLDSLVRDTK